MAHKTFKQRSSLISEHVFSPLLNNVDQAKVMNGIVKIFCSSQQYTNL